MPVHFRNYRAAIRAVIGGGLNVNLTPHEVLIGNALGGIGQVPALGTAGQVLSSNGPGADPSWQNAAGAGDRDVWLSGLFLPTGLGYTPIAETIPRPLCTNANSLTSGTPRIQAIPLPAGKLLSQMTMETATTAEAGGTHGWYALLDNTFKVLAVTADQVGATVWSPGNSPITLAFTAGFTTLYRGTYYVVVCVTATTPPNITAYAQGANSGALALAPALGGLGAAGQNTPPALGSTVSISSVALEGMHATVG